MDRKLQKSLDVEVTRLPVLCEAGPVGPLAGRLAFVAVPGLQGEDQDWRRGPQLSSPVASAVGGGVSGMGADLWCQAGSLASRV